MALHHFPIFSHFFLSPNIQTAGIAVDFFFVLSGFVITHASLPDLTSWRAGFVFAVRRFGRLWPLHATMLFALVALEVVKLIFTNETGMSGRLAAFASGSEKSVVSIPTNLLMIQALDIHDKWTWNGPSWSISTEFYTYLLFAVMAITANKYITQISSALSLACGVFFLFVGPNIDTSYQYGTFRCICGFFIGHIVYRLWESSNTKPLGRPSWWEWSCIGLLSTFPLLPLFQNFSILIPLLLAVPVWVFAHQQGPISAFLTGRSVQYLGLLSYSIYLDHQLVIDIIKRGLFVIERVTRVKIIFSGISIIGVEGDYFKIGNEWIGDAITLVYICVVIILAGITYRLIESPGRRYFNSLAKRFRTPAAAVAENPAAGS